MTKVAMIGVMAVLLAIPLRRDKSELGVALILGACLLMGGLALGKVSELVTFFQKVGDSLGANQLYIQILLKMIGITYVAEFGASLCQDAGYSAIAGQIEFYGKLMILAVSLPVLQTLLDTLQSFWS